MATPEELRRMAARKAMASDSPGMASRTDRTLAKIYAAMSEEAAGYMPPDLEAYPDVPTVTEDQRRQLQMARDEELAGRLMRKRTPVPQVTLEDRQRHVDALKEQAETARATLGGGDPRVSMASQRYFEAAQDLERRKQAEAGRAAQRKVRSTPPSRLPGSYYYEQLPGGVKGRTVSSPYMPGHDEPSNIKAMERQVQRKSLMKEVQVDPKTLPPVLDPPPTVKTMPTDPSTMRSLLQMHGLALPPRPAAKEKK